ncbi:MAG: prepilin-type N-terminal cleavage/methylation domain-containing protein, partial [Gammaproteobacteria bacterium]|nr:prepilin-type N-terminal cleavage/methylation domain-containing protein [Gammaproteobacteria bacterium]
MRNQNGISLIELLVVVAVAAVALVTTVAFSMPWMAKETMRSAAHDLQAVMQLTRIEAVSRNHACRFVLNTDLGQMQVWDTRGTGGASDDELLH